ncbi:MAG: PrsW family glutamic-type intramembrane protease [Bacteroidota bacterium]
MIFFFLKIAFSIVPVFVFLAALIYLDSYKLVHLRSVVTTIILGCVVAGAAMAANYWPLTTPYRDSYIRYGAPFVEELLKSVYPVYLIRSKKVGFMVDAAIRGFGIGAGFAFIENVYYLNSVSSTNLIVWAVRGFGTAVMHGGTTAILATVYKNMTDVKNSDDVKWLVPGFLTAVVIHSFFNHFFFSPLISAVIVIAVLPVIMLFVFSQSEKSTRNWLGVGFDSDAALLNMITTGNVAKTRIGVYLELLQTKFRGEVVADLLCYLRIYLELAIQAKGILLMREAGFDVPADPEIKAKFDELQYLERSIGKTGQLAMAPFVRTSSNDLWQLQLLQ